MNSELLDADAVRAPDGKTLLFLSFPVESSRQLDHLTRLSGSASATLKPDFRSFLQVCNEGFESSERVSTRLLIKSSTENSIQILEIPERDFRELTGSTGWSCTLLLNDAFIGSVVEWFDGTCKRIGSETGHKAAQAVLAIPVDIAELPLRRRLEFGNAVENPFDHCQEVDQLTLCFYADRDPWVRGQRKADHQPNFPPMLFSV